MNGERVFEDVENIPTDISTQLWEIIKEYHEEGLDDIKLYFDELLSFKRAVFMIELYAPLVTIFEAERLLFINGYCVHNDLDMGFIPEDCLGGNIPDEPELGGCLYVSLRPQFIELAKASCADIGGAALEGLMFGFNVRNIIGYLDMPPLTDDEEREYLESFED